MKEHKFVFAFFIMRQDECNEHILQILRQLGKVSR